MKYGILFLLLIFLVIPVCAEYIPDDFTGIEPLTVSFTDVSINNPTAWKWTFKDVTGNNTEIIFSRLQNPTWTFYKGNYSIRLYAGNSDGTNATPSMLAFLNVTSMETITPIVTQTPIITPIPTQTVIITPTPTQTVIITPTSVVISTPVPAQTPIKHTSGNYVKSMAGALNLINITPNNSNITILNLTPTFQALTVIQTPVPTQVPKIIMTPNSTLVSIVNSHHNNIINYFDDKNKTMIDDTTMSFSKLASPDIISSTIIPLIIVIGILIGGAIFIIKFGVDTEE